MNNEVIDLAKIIWDYHHMNQKLEKSDIIMVLGSHDTRVADRWVKLFNQWYSDKILFSGGVWRLTNTDPNFAWTTEAELFAKIAIDNWVPKWNIIIENKSTNTGENIRFSYELVKDLLIKSIILVQKPYMERRTFATFSKQRPGEEVVFYVTSPLLSFDEYCNLEIPMDKAINIMVWDLQRIIEYPKKWFQTYEEVPENVLEAYEKLISLWFTKSLI